MPSKKQPYTMYLLRWLPRQAKAVQRHARKTKTPVSQVIRQAIDYYLEESK